MGRRLGDGDRSGVEIGGLGNEKSSAGESGVGYSDWRDADAEPHVEVANVGELRDQADKA